MTAFVIEHDGKIARELGSYVAPNAQVGAERIGKDKHWLVTATADQLIMDRGVVDIGELHWKSPRERDCRFNLVK
jgi:hypothetical protein